MSKCVSPPPPPPQFFLKAFCKNSISLKIFPTVTSFFDITFSWMFSQADISYVLIARTRLSVPVDFSSDFANRLLPIHAHFTYNVIRLSVASRLQGTVAKQRAPPLSTLRSVITTNKLFASALRDIRRKREREPVELVFSESPIRSIYPLFDIDVGRVLICAD